jgi:hypothetical protein
MIGAALTAAHDCATSDWAPYIEAGARRLAAAIAAVYVAGLCVGAAIHAANDWLAPRFAAVALRADVCGYRPSPGAEPATEPQATPEPQVPAAPVAPHVQPMADTAETLMALSAKTLRAMAGVRSKAHTKAALVAMICAV